MSNFKEKYIGDKAFYRRVLLLVLPMILQAGVTNFVSMIDNIMVGQIGTAQMSGVSIVNQFVFVFNITVFGAMSGPGIFGAQFFGKGDHEGQRYTFRYRLICCAAIIGAGMLILWLFREPLISLYLSKDDSPEAIAATLGYGLDYLGVVLFSLIPFAIGQAYSSVVKECGETLIPMLGSVAAVGVNLVLDYGLIFGRLGMPEMGVKGAALATVIAKVIEALVVVIWAHTHPDKNRYIVGLFRHFTIPKTLAWDIFKKSLPLLINEFLWSAGMSVIAQCYSVRGLDVVAARNIGNTITNLFSVVYVQMGACIGILLGQKLGAGELTEARDWSHKLTFFTLVMSVIVGLLMLPIAGIFPGIYNTEPAVKSLASYMILICALAMPMWSYTNAAYFTIRSGGRTGITFLFDFGFTWLLQIPLAFGLSHFTSLDIHILYAVVVYAEMIKAVVGYLMMKSGMWVRRIVA